MINKGLKRLAKVNRGQQGFIEVSHRLKEV